ncbi:MAG: hypothetical protein COZ49_03630 [Candidatus Yonathbacteria bacterium CG_4_10_14_3_um_filter_47_65]|nr:MAG: hypothetical protein COZ49_03630 [Candidatus Yonathbacteria bacterium CG_4_10_14_3_um_filter_47_65]PIY57993.1 MAG: hypothetical protein COY99_00275 [Candidatus Yonathbacteria bacterium CG_4_10_14_0_8_um_filter_47_645]PJC20767.1 MAG: hypothetical protein CO061_01595 [Candidatus Yonathbacteria bacterium CG_4_9_14_0_2_um_filter_47_74]PJC66882.1 MAG: hypothetical protein CO016_04190 [Candidatus Yonathbacteria bacterium CG_4_8_14_3_um_filter_46_25]
MYSLTRRCGKRNHVYGKHFTKNGKSNAVAKLQRKNDTTMYTDKGESYDGLVLDGYKHKKINHPKTIIIAKARM